MEDNPFAGPKKPSMKRRADFNDYHNRRMYMITLTIEGRRQLFGRVIGNTNALSEQTGCDQQHQSEKGKVASIELTELGKKIAEHWMDIPSHDPEVEVAALQMMPDHLHGILFVREHMQKHLGDVIHGFKIGCNKEYRRLLAGMPGMPGMSGMSTSDVDVLNRGGGRNGERSGRRYNPHSATGLLFEPGYNDKVLYGRGQLQRWIAYLHDNPRRLLMKRQHPDLFRIRRGMNVKGMQFDAIGNIFLLSKPEILQIQVSRRATEEELTTLKKEFLTAAGRGAVAVSPGISPGERAIMRALYEQHAPVIVLLQNGFGKFAKPGGALFDACAEGRLLLLAPWEHSNERKTITRQECLILNEMARKICKE